MREFLILPVAAFATFLAAVIVGPLLLVHGLVLAYGERRGWARTGVMNRDRYLAELEHNPFGGQLPELRRRNGLDHAD